MRKVFGDPSTSIHRQSIVEQIGVGEASDGDVNRTLALAMKLPKLGAKFGGCCRKRTPVFT